MIQWFLNTTLLEKTILATLFTFGVTTVGSSIVFLFKKVNKTLLDSMLGLSAGIMIAATFWSLLNPAIEQATELQINVCLVVSLGFICGGLFLNIGDYLYNYCSNLNKSLKRIVMLVFSITLHNIPEGLAIGVAFGSLNYGISSISLIDSCLLALGIGIQNFPEGSAVSLPLRREGISRFKSFLVGSLTGIVEPFAAILGYFLVIYIKTILPFLLAFAGGAMIYVVVKELIPESQNSYNKNLITMFTLIGFVIMMFLDVSLG